MAAIGAALPISAPSETSSADPGAVDKARLNKAAVDFEAVLLGQWLDGAEKSFGTVPGSEEDEDAGGEQMRSFAMQSLSHALAARDTLGIAKLVEHGLEQANGKSAANTPALPPTAAEGAWRAKLAATP